MPQNKYEMPAHIKELRRQCLTGTDMAALSGYSKWGGLVDVWMEKKKEVYINRPSNDRMIRGQRFEALVAEWYTDETGIELKASDFIKNGIYGGSPDRIPVDEKYSDLFIEIKTAESDQRYNWGEAGTDEVPMQYLIQCAWYMFLLNRSQCNLAVLIGLTDFRIYKLRRDEELEKKLIMLADRFWEKYVKGSATPPINGSDNFKNYLQHRYKKGNGVILQPTELIYTKAKELKELETQADIIKEKIDAIKNHFRFFIGENEGIKGEGISIPWSTVKGAEYIDWDAIKAELNISDEVINKHKKRKADHRRLQVRVGA